MEAKSYIILIIDLIYIPCVLRNVAHVPGLKKESAKNRQQAWHSEGVILLLPASRSRSWFLRKILRHDYDHDSWFITHLMWNVVFSKVMPAPRPTTWLGPNYIESMLFQQRLQLTHKYRAGYAVLLTTVSFSDTWCSAQWHLEPWSVKWFDQLPIVQRF